MLIYPRWKSCVKIRSCGVGEALSKAFKKQAFPLLVFTLKGRQEPLSPLISSPPLFLTITFSTPPYSGIWQKLNSCNKLWGKQSSPVLLSSSEKKLGGFLLSLFLYIFCKCKVSSSRGGDVCPQRWMHSLVITLPLGWELGVQQFWKVLSAWRQFARIIFTTEQSGQIVHV